jgi:uncharacterized membrane protein YesL
MGGFFNPERGIWAALSTLVDVCGLSILWLFLCLPVVTIGPATAALYYTVVKCVRGRESGAFKYYLLSLRDNMKVGCAATLLCLLAGALLAGGYALMRANAASTSAAGVLFGAYYTALLLPAGVLCWLFPLLGRFTFGVRELFATALQLAVRHLPSTVVVTLLTAETAAFCIPNWWPALFMPAVTALLSSFFLERVFQKYAPQLIAEDGEEEA